ncbi:MAG TPA: hypothetical protein VNX22_01465 [Acidobacteriaceae bacterium]|nr:hypothetical protein [Acidobacteriaceae bacterium]
MFKRILAATLFLTAFAGPSVAQTSDNSAKKQDAPSPTTVQNDARYFRLDFVVRELDGKRTVSSRNYSMPIMANDRFHRGAAIRTGNRVPVLVSTKDTQYLDIGVNIDCSEPETIGAELSMLLTADISSLPDLPGGSQSSPPILWSTKWRSATLVAIAKPTIVFTAEDEHTGHVLQVEVTATPLH